MKVTRIQQIAFLHDGKLWVEGKIERDKEIRADKKYELWKKLISDEVDAKMDNEELTEWKNKNMGGEI